MKREIIPVILAKDAADFRKKLAVIKTLRPAPRMIQVDIVDGKFAPYKTWNSPEKAASLLKGIYFEVDLMTTDSLKHARAWAQAGAKRILFHVEAVQLSSRVPTEASGRGDLASITGLLRSARNDIKETIQYIHSHGAEAGLSLNPDTPIEALKPFLPPTSPPPTSGGGRRRGAIDCVLLLGVNPGKSGQQFQKKILAKIRSLRKAHPQLPIEVDGGVNLRNAQAILQAGATRLATASALLGADTPQEAYRTFLSLRF